MTPQRPRTSLFYYVPVLLIAVGIVLYVFFRNYQKGEQVGLNTPPPAEGRKGSEPVVDQQALARNTGLATEGKTLYQINCASCHGADGTGKGDRAASLNPPPRNFKSDQFKFGSDIVSIHNTILKGSPGTSMPSFALLTPQETWALAHFVYTLIPEPPPITDELVAQLPAGGGAGSTTEGAPAGDNQGSTSAPAAGGEPQGPRIPILLAMDQIAKQAAPRGQPATVNASHPGAAIYSQHCARCHGAQGEGQQLRPISVAPYQFQETVSFVNLKSPWLADRNKFGELVVKGLPGRSMPGQATLTRQQIDDLYAFVRSFSTTVK